MHMNEQTWQVVYRGIQAGRDEERFKADLGKLFKADVASLERIFSQAPAVVKRDLKRDTAERVAQALKSIGALRDVEPSTQQSASQLEMEREATPLEAAPQERPCPRCGYALERVSPDGAGMTECPKCGIIVEKVKTGAIAAPRKQPDGATGALPLGVQSKTDHTHNADSSPVDTKRKIYACVTTYSTWFMAYVLIEAILLVTMWLAYPPSALDSHKAAIEARNNLQAMRALLIAVFLTYILVIRPVIHGATYGQEQMGIALKTGDGESPSFMPCLLRLVGHFLSPLTLALALFNRLGSKSWISLADRISGTRQEAVAPFPGNPLRLALKPAALSMAVFIVLMPLKSWTGHAYTKQVQGKLTGKQGVEPTVQQSPQVPPVQTHQNGPTDLPTSGTGKSVAPKTRSLSPMQRAMFMEKNQNAFRQGLVGRVAQFENLYHSKYQRYTDDIHELFFSTCPDCSDRDEVFALAAMGQVLIRLNGDGFEAGVRVSPDSWHIVTDRGLQSPRPSFP